MPFIEVFAFEGRVTDKQAAAQQLTRAFCDAFAIDANIVTIFFIDVPPTHFFHGGTAAPAGGPNSMFVKVRALRRGRDMHRKAASSLTSALCRTNCIGAGDVAIYFLEREEDECAYGGRLTSDVKTD